MVLRSLGVIISSVQRYMKEQFLSPESLWSKVQILQRIKNLLSSVFQLQLIKFAVKIKIPKYQSGTQVTETSNNTQ